MSGTHQGEFSSVQATGKEIATSGMSIFRLAGDRIVKVWVESDNISMMQQLGVMPTPGQI